MKGGFSNDLEVLVDPDLGLAGLLVGLDHADGDEELSDVIFDEMVTMASPSTVIASVALLADPDLKLAGLLVSLDHADGADCRHVKNPTNPEDSVDQH